MNDEPVGLIRKHNGYVTLHAQSPAQLARLDALPDGAPLYAAPSPAQGWRMVPVEPTRAMIDAGWDAACKEPFSKAAMCYRAMLNAAPPPPAGEAE